ncbi:MAG: DUF1440 domain-containing protein [Bacteroidota bacterium]|nr:DUF1440 domain-containing protein [Bacteroidota bacterium]
MFSTRKSRPWFKSLKTIVFSGIIAGTLDIIGVIIIYAVLLDKTTGERILQNIANGLFGKAAYAGGMETAFYGLIFHYIIATSWATGYFLIFPIIPFLRKQKILSGLFYGVTVWLMMNLVLLPLFNVKMPPFTLQGVLIGIGMLMFFIGLPISLITHKYYETISE